MIRLQTDIRIPGLYGREVTDFLLNCDDSSYQAWWPGVHPQFHTVRRLSGDVGNVVYMDEYIGRFRLKFHAVVIAAVPGTEVACQFVRGVAVARKAHLAPTRRTRRRSNFSHGRGRYPRSGAHFRCAAAPLAHARIRKCAGRTRADRIPEIAGLTACAKILHREGVRLWRSAQITQPIAWSVRLYVA